MMRPHAFQTLCAFLLLGAVATQASAHELTFTGNLDGAQAGNDSDSTGEIHFQTDEHSQVFDVLSFHVEGILLENLDRSHGPNATAFHVHLAEAGAGRHGGILIDLGWYVDAGFGTITPTASGFDVEISGILTSVQGAYDLTAATGLTPEDVFLELEEGNGVVIVHSLDYPMGEIAGRLVPDDPTPTSTTTWGELKAGFLPE